MGRKPLDPEVAADRMRQAGLEPLEAYPGSTKPWRCRCNTCGVVVTPRYANVYTTGKGCLPCGRGMDDPTSLYVVYSSEADAVKIGVTKERTKRLAVLKSSGFTLVGTIPFTQGSNAYAAEQEVLRRVRAMGLKSKLWKAEMGQAAGGHTETFDAQELSPDVLWGILWRTVAEGNGG